MIALLRSAMRSGRLLIALLVAGIGVRRGAAQIPNAMAASAEFGAPLSRKRAAFALLGTLMALVLTMGAAQAQIADQLVLFGIDHSFNNQIARFDRKLSLLGLTQTNSVGAGGGILDGQSGVAVDAHGRYWVPFDGLNDTKVLRMESDGTLILPSINLQHNPVYLVTTPWDVTYVLTRIPLFAAG